jgi:hypothetical protein
MFDFGTVRFEFGNVQYELYESSRELMFISVLFIVCTHLKVIFDKNFEKNLKKNVKLFLSFLTKISKLKNLNNNLTSVIFRKKEDILVI